MDEKEGSANGRGNSLTGKGRGLEGLIDVRKSSMEWKINRRKEVVADGREDLVDVSVWPSTSHAFH